MKREVKESKDKVIKYENKSNDKDVTVMGRQKRSGQHSEYKTFAQIVDMKVKMCDIEVKIIDIQKNIKVEVSFFIRPE